MLGNRSMEWLRSEALALPELAKFALGMVMIVGVTALSRRVRLPSVVGLLLAGMLIGPHGLDLFSERRPVADFAADIGKLLLMFFIGLEINLVLFRQSRRRAIAFGLITTAAPLLLGTAVALWFGYAMVPSIVVGSLLASHTLLAAPIVIKAGANRLEPYTITVGATVMSDTLSLIVFAVCVSTFQRGFSGTGLAKQVAEIALFIPALLWGVSRGGAYLLKKVGDDEQAYFLLMFGMMALAVALTQLVDLPGIVGAFLAGLAVNAAVQDKPAKEKLEFFGNSLFIPIFFVVTGFLIDPVVFAQSLRDHFGLAVAIVAALIAGKGIAAAIVSRLFSYGRAARMTMWSLTLPQVAATLAATLTGFQTLNAAGERLIDRQMLDVVFVLIVVTSTLGPLLTQHYIPLLLEASQGPEHQAAA